jgi:hypothetical protein
MVVRHVNVTSTDFSACMATLVSCATPFGVKIRIHNGMNTAVQYDWRSFLYYNVNEEQPPDYPLNIGRLMCTTTSQYANLCQYLVTGRAMSDSIHYQTPLMSFYKKQTTV